MEKKMYGRALLASEIRAAGLTLDQSMKNIDKYPAFHQEGKLQCFRCSNDQKEWMEPTVCQCGSDCFYCRQCLNMGLVKRCDYFYHLTEANAFKPIKEPVLTWQGSLSTQQAQASKEIISTIQNRGTRLVWAVAGAGKTEMLFEGIAHALHQGDRIALVSPRVDVCLELGPRLQAAFQGVDQQVLHGSMTEDYRYTQLVIATTHQLLRFKQAFDLVIIDEIDAFPFHNNRMLNVAANEARKKNSALIYLTATPDQAMQREVAKGRLKASILPARYHGYPLPEPDFLWAGNWFHQALHQPDRSPIIAQMDSLIKKNRRFLTFVPNIDWMDRFARVCHHFFPDTPFHAVSSKDPDRKKKVMDMREGQVHFLLTTSILERGVTFKDIDVLVIGAEDRVFTESALVQISGRVGRSPDFPTGQVLFFHYGKSRAMKRAKRQIQTMNAMARERGLLNYD